MMPGKTRKGTGTRKRTSSSRSAQKKPIQRVGGTVPAPPGAAEPPSVPPRGSGSGGSDEESEEPLGRELVELTKKLIPGAYFLILFVVAHWLLGLLLDHIPLDGVEASIRDMIRWIASGQFAVIGVLKLVKEVGVEVKKTYRRLLRA
jgi:hypothetical protein